MPRKLIVPSEDEDRVITAATEADPDNPPLDNETLERLEPRGREARGGGQGKLRINRLPGKKPGI